IVDALELLVSEAAGEGSITEVIRPAAIIPEDAARHILQELVLHDARVDGTWLAEPTVWRPSARPLDGAEPANLIGSLQVAYGTPTRYEITVYRATVTGHGTEKGWTVASLCDEGLPCGGPK